MTGIEVSLYEAMPWNVRPNVSEKPIRVMLEKKPPLIAEVPAGNTALRTWINPVFGERAPGSITAADVQEWVALLAAELAPRSVLKYWQVLAQVLDYAEIVPNPTRHKTVKLPYADVEEATPPSREDFLAIVGHLAPRLRLPAVFLEQTAARVSELRAWE